MVTSQRQAVQFGITQEELDQAIAVRREMLKQVAATGRTGSSAGLAEAYAANLDSDPPFVSPKDMLALFEEQVPTVKLAEVNAALRARFADTPTLIYRGSEPPAGGVKALEAAYASAKAKPVTAYAHGCGEAVAVHEFRHARGGGGAQADRRSRRYAGALREWREADGEADAVPQGPDRACACGWGGRIGMPSERIDASDMGCRSGRRAGSAS